MELCSTRAVSLSTLQPRRFLVNHFDYPAKPTFHLKSRIHFSGLLSRTRTLLKATLDDTSSSETNKFTGERTDSVVTLEDVPYVDNDVTLDKVSPVSESLYDNNSQPQPPVGETSSDDLMQPLNELLAKLNLKLDSEDSYTIFLYGGGALLAVWLLSAVVGAIDSIPVFPKLMEVVGLGYSLWFTTRYLLFKRNREELVLKIEELKKEIVGSNDN